MLTSHPLLTTFLLLLLALHTTPAQALSTPATQPNGERMIVTRGDDGRVDGRRLYRVADGVNLSHLTYAYDADDNITRITDRLDASKTLSFAYDEVSRLKRVTLAESSAAPMKRTDYVFDANGNRSRVLTRPLATDPPELALTERYGLVSGSNRLASIRAPAA